LKRELRLSGFTSRPEKKVQVKKRKKTRDCNRHLWGKFHFRGRFHQEGRARETEGLG